MKKPAKQALLKKLVARLYDKLSAQGYQLAKKNEEYRFRYAQGEIMLFQNVQYTESLMVDCKYFVHNELIDALVERVTVACLPSWQHSPYFYYSSKRVYGDKMNEMVGATQMEALPLLSIDNEVDVIRIADHQLEYIERVVQKYFGQFKDMATIYGFLSPYLMGLSEEELVITDQADPLYGYLAFNEYVSLMTAARLIEAVDYEEISRRVLKIFDGLFIHKAYVKLDEILRAEY